MADDGSRNGCPRSPGRRCIILSIGRTLLAKSADPLRHPPKRPRKRSANWVKTGLSRPASREQTANVDFANGIPRIDDVERPQVFHVIPGLAYPGLAATQRPFCVRPP